VKTPVRTPDTSLVARTRSSSSLARAVEQVREDAQAAEELRFQAKAENTTRAYRADFEAFEVYCRRVQVDWRNTNAKFLATYLASMLRRENVTAATIKRARSGISNAFRAEGVTPNPARGSEVRETLEGICRKLGTAQKKKEPLLVEHLLKMFAAMKDNLSGKRDRALLAVGFTGAFRRSELVALCVEDVTFSKRGAEILIRRSKTDQQGKGRTLGIPRQPTGSPCPVTLLEDWLLAARITNGPLFRSVRKGNSRQVGADGLRDGAVAAIVKRYAVAAGLDPEKVAGHSLRSGLATQADIDGVAESVTMAQTGHKSLLVFRGYVQKGSVFKKNAAAGMWDRRLKDSQ